jgi:MoxR-like ATPase
MNKKIYGLIRLNEDSGKLRVFNANNMHEDITHLFRDIMINKAHEFDQALSYDTITEMARRIAKTDIEDDIMQLEVVNPVDVEVDPVLQLINTSNEIKPSTLEITDLKWKYLIRSVVRGKNILIVGPAGFGKTETAKALPTATNRPFFVFNLGSTQDPRATLIGNTHFKDGETVFDKSSFIKAITTENAIVLLDELSRAHPEAWNILMTVLDEGQRYIRLDEDVNSPIIHVAPGVSFIATANIGNEYTSTRVLDRALKDRFEIIEVDILNKDREFALLKKKFPKLSDKILMSVADIADITRTEWKGENSKLATMISTRMSVRVCELLADGFTLTEASEVALLPFFDVSGGADSERIFVKQVIQKHIATEENDIFNVSSALNVNLKEEENLSF